MPAPTPPEAIEARINAVHHAAMTLFTERGFSGTSMAAIAEAAGLSRPALYQHFANREDIFRSAAQRILDEAHDNAMAQLQRDQPLVKQLDGYLQCGLADVIGPHLASPHGSEIFETTVRAAADVSAAAAKARADGLYTFLVEVTGGNKKLAARAGELIELGALGLKHDKPNEATFRKRLTTLAESAAALIQQGT